MPETPATTTPTLRDRRARLAVSAVFALHGAATGSWAARIPWVKEARHLSSADLGGALMGAAIGGLAAMPLAAWLLARFGSRRVTRAGVLAAAAVLPLPAFGPGPGTIFAGLFLFGATGGLLDVAMNANGVAVQERYRRSIMAALHGLWSIGGLTGAAAAGLVARAGVAAPAHLVVVGVVMAVLGTLAGIWLAPTPPAAAARVFARPDRALLLLGLITFCGLFGESAASDWSAVYLRSAAHTTSAVAAWGYAAFSLAMAAGRLAGDRLVGRFGPARVTRVAALIGAAGLAAGLATPYVPLIIAGFVLLGLGVATVVPLTFSAAGRAPGHDPGTAVAAVATVGYGGWMIAPPVIGLVAQGTSLTFSLAVVAVVTALIAIPAGALGGRA